MCTAEQVSRCLQALSSTPGGGVTTAAGLVDRSSHNHVLIEEGELGSVGWDSDQMVLLRSLSQGKQGSCSERGTM